MKARIGIIISLLLIASIIIGGAYLRQKEIDTAYNYAVYLIRNGYYNTALTEFENANHNKFNRDYFLYKMRSSEIKRAYKNTLPLYSYALGHICYDNEKMDMTKDYIDLIPSDYGGELSEEIKLFKENFKTEYDEYLAEEARMAKQKREEEKKKEQNNKGQAKSSYSSSSRTKKTYNDDTYDVKDYYDAEDFYDDHYDDFYDYEDAEDYYNENGMW